MRSCIKIISGLTLIFQVCITHAFKVDTHVWVGQQVVNDLADDGKLNFNLNGDSVDIAIDPGLVSAIIDNRSAYLMGNIGPDAVPDVLVGQMIVHPGIDNDPSTGKWQTSDWLKYILNSGNNSGSDLGRAFSYGYLSHASADVFAHTYVNQYAGDVFSLMDGETIVEQRHFMLEGYISKHLPPLVDHNGKYLVDHNGKELREPWEQLPDLINKNLDEKDSVNIYANYIRDNLIYADEVTDQYKKFGSASHLSAFSKLHKTVKEEEGNVLWGEIDEAVVKLILNNFGYTATDKDAEQVRVLTGKLHAEVSELIGELQNVNADVTKIIEKWSDSGIKLASNSFDKLNEANTKYLDKKNEYLKAVQALNSEIVMKGCSFAMDHIHDSIDLAIKLDPVLAAAVKLDPITKWTAAQLFGGGGDCYKDDDWSNGYVGDNRFNSEFIYTSKALILATADGYAGQRCEKNNDYAKILRYALELEASSIVPDPIVIIHGDIPIPITYERFEKIKAVQNADFVKIYIKDMDTPLLEITADGGNYKSKDSGICNTFSKMVDLNDYLLFGAVNQLEQEVSQLQKDKIEKLNDLHDETIDALKAIEAATDQGLNLFRVLIADSSPIKAALGNWREDIEEAHREYVKATSQTIINSINHNVIDTNGDGIKDSVYEPISSWITCYATQTVALPSQIGGCNGVLGELNNVIEKMQNVSAILADLSDPTGLIAELKKRIDSEINVIKREIEEVLTEIVEKLLPKELVAFLELLDQEINDETLNLTFSQSIDSKSLVIINDVALRVKAEMNLTADGKFNPDKYPVIRNAITMSKLSLLNNEQLLELAKSVPSIDSSYYPLIHNVNNAIADAFNDIDGNHQWMPIMPPLPRANSEHYYRDHEVFGLIDGYATDAGFIFWQGDLREKLFMKLFIGPLTPGITSPETIDFNAVVPANYPYRACSGNTFPLNIDDEACMN